MTQVTEEIKLGLSDKILFLIYTLYLILKPFYFWSSGLPQLSDIIMLVLIISYLTKNGMVIQFYKKQRNFLIIGFIFVLYVLILNLIWMLKLDGSLNFIITSTFYIYNLIITLIIVAMYYDYNEKIIEVTYQGTLISLIIQFMMYVIGGGFSGGRMIGGFNNPNQLGYYALLSLSILLFANSRIYIKTQWFILGITISLILCISSLSKAAILAFAIMLFLFLFSRNINKKIKKNFIIISILFVLIFTNIYIFDSDIIISNRFYNSVHKRINSIGADNDDSLEGRGYDRIINFPEYWIFGAGEGEYDRFRHINMEFHSTLGNIQVSYGMIGLSLFIMFMYMALKSDNYKSLYIIVSIMAYGLTHNGIRNSMFWILLALISTKEHKIEDIKLNIE